MRAAALLHCRSRGSSDNAVMELPVIYAGVKNEEEEDVASSPASSIPRYSFSLLGDVPSSRFAAALFCFLG